MNHSQKMAKKIGVRLAAAEKRRITVAFKSIATLADNANKWNVQHGHSPTFGMMTCVQIQGLLNGIAALYERGAAAE